MMISKHKYIRSPKLLKMVRDLACQCCGSENGTIVAAHTNWGGGKGRSVKADDNLIAALCFTCHSELDQGRMLTKDQRKRMWVVAHYRTVRKLVNSNQWPQDVPIPFNPEFEEIYASCKET